MRRMKVYKNFMSKGFIAHIMPDIDFAITYLATYAKCDYYDLENQLDLSEYNTLSEGDEGYYPNWFNDVKGYILRDEIEERIDTIHRFNHYLVEFLQGESKSYQDFFRTDIAPRYIEPMNVIFSNKEIEYKIFKEEFDVVDGLYDVYMVLNAMYKILNNIEQLMTDKELLKDILNYRLDRYRRERFQQNPANDNTPLIENLQATPNVEDILPMPDAIVWNGTPSEMALLMNTLADKGYIDCPVRKNGEKNRAEFHRSICSHFELANGSHISVLNSLKDNRIAPDNLFKIAMDKLPKRD
ncbi:MAG: hypothetical protein SNI58_05075 [Rikenellaceae bacterium]